MAAPPGGAALFWESEMASNYTPMNKAVPAAGLLQPVDDGRLAFEGGAWSHLCAYFEQVNELPEPLEGVSAETTVALRTLRELARAFGSPSHLRALLTENPDILASAEPPVSVFAGLAWISARLHADAERMVGGLATLASLQYDAPGENLEDEARAALWDLAKTAAGAVGRARPVGERTARLVGTLPQAHAALQAALETDGEALQELQVEGGRLQQQVTSLNEQIANLSVLTSRTKRQALTDELEAVQVRLAAGAARAEALRGGLAMLEPLRRESGWLAAALDDICAFIVSHRTVWAEINNGLTEVPTRATAEEVTDPKWMQAALGMPEADRRWRAVEGAGAAFATKALADW